MNFRYKARDRSGSVQVGSVSAADRSGALTQLQQNGLFVSELKAAGGFKLDLNAEIHLSASLGKVKVADLAIFCSQFSALAGAGVPILQSLQVLTRHFKGRKLAKIIESIIRSIEGGDSLSQAMRAHKDDLPPALIYITSVAEVTGRLDEAYGLLARQFEQEDEFTRKVKGALAYPMAVLVIAVIVILFMITFVLPTYGNMFQQMGAQLPAPTRAMMAFGKFLKSYWLLIPVVPVLFGLLVRQAMKNDRIRGAWQSFLLKLPVWGELAYKRELASLCRTLGTMNKSGVPLLAALLSVQEALDFLPIRQALAQVQEGVRGGDRFGHALQQQKLFDRISVEIINLGEMAGNLDTMLFRVAGIAEKDVNSLLGRLTALLEPVLTVVLGGAVLAIILPMLLPMFDILGQIK